MTNTVPQFCTLALDELVSELLEQGGIEGPPVDALELAERLRIAVAFDGHQGVRGRHKRLAGRPSIFLRPDERPERIQWAAAHELGEVVAFRFFERTGCAKDDVSPPMREQAANLLASRLLLPTEWFRDDARRFEGDLFRLKRQYRTASHELIAYRLLDLPEPSIVTVFDQGRLVRRRGNQPGTPSRLQPVERDCWIQTHRSNEPVELCERGLHAQGWPIHEAGWKREVLRTRLIWDGDVMECFEE